MTPRRARSYRMAHSKRRDDVSIVIGGIAMLLALWLLTVLLAVATPAVPA